ncbi:hypothetical protein Mic7113_4039 [Allocoleopsis franciscana PCC 7113]|uniref:Uncharacterized protein n=1 Tax=Allocoleopsis franciscana PCC 7113 TaxID=1173027 RepID=K9WIZ2_9CYAN|nr:hypothetical protein Mic7113_4039 [Allocoleopsis franciscana PCC 7113]
MSLLGSGGATISKRLKVESYKIKNFNVQTDHCTRIEAHAASIFIDNVVDKFELPYLLGLGVNTQKTIV